MTELSSTVSAETGRDLRLTIGVFDSGVGGLSVLRVLRQHLPEALRARRQAPPPPRSPLRRLGGARRSSPARRTSLWF